jgi:8-oxo-dGTP pyrophosphatase MutT (NUDIX family)
MRLAKIALAQARLAGRLSTFMSCAPAPAWSAPTRVRLSKPEGARMYSRVYPDAPRVGVGVVVLRHNPHTSVPEVLLIKRGTVRVPPRRGTPHPSLSLRRKPTRGAVQEPDKGKWCVPGGGLELGETVVECAAREVFEETGIVVRTASGTESLMGCGIVPQLGCASLPFPLRWPGRQDTSPSTGSAT